MPNRVAAKKPCGKCDDECAAGNAVVCGFCEFWFHSACVEGMTPEFVKSCDAMNRVYGGSSFICGICRKITGKLNQSMREMQLKVDKMQADLTTASLERRIMAEKIEHMETKNRQVDESVQKIEGEVVAGMAKAKEEVKDEMKGEMREEMKEREEKKENIVVYGLGESEEEDGKKRKEDDLKAVYTMVEAIDVDFRGEIKGSYRAGAKVPGGRPRPLIVTVEDEETREKILANARRMAGKEEWKRVYVAQDLTWRQREEIRNEEKKLKEKAEKRTKEENDEGKSGKYVVVGQRGKRWIKWIREVGGE